MMNNDSVSSLSGPVIPTSERVLQVLAQIAGHGSPITVRELAVQTKLPLSTLYRHLVALKKWGLVQEQGQNGLYQPGPLSLQLALGFDQHSHLMQVAHREMVELAEKTAESVGLLVLVNEQMICLDIIESQQPLRCSIAKGTASSAVHGASAKALLAYLPEAKLAPLLANYPNDSVTLPAQLAQCRQDGYAVSLGEIDADIWGVSAPIFSAPSRIACTLTLMAPAVRAKTRSAELIELTQSAAARISRQLTGK